MTYVTIKYSTGFIGKKWAKIFIDDKKVGDIFTGESKSYELGPGQHTIQIKQIMIGGPKHNFKITDDEQYFVFKDSFFNNFMVWVSLFLPLIYFLFATPLGFEGLIFLLIVFVLSTLYIFIFRRNRFYEFENTNSPNI